MIETDPFEDFVGEEVVDSHGNTIGTLACYWEHAEGIPVLLGIDVGEVAHRIHLMPAKGAQPNERQTYVVASYNKDKVRQAPCLDCGCELDRGFEKKVFAFYGERAVGYKMRDDVDQTELRRIVRGESPTPPVDSDARQIKPPESDLKMR